MTRLITSLALNAAAKCALPYFPLFETWGALREGAIDLVREQSERNGESLDRDRARLMALRLLCECIADENWSDASAARDLEDHLIEDARIVVLCAAPVRPVQTKETQHA